MAAVGPSIICRLVQHPDATPTAHNRTNAALGRAAQPSPSATRPSGPVARGQERGKRAWSSRQRRAWGPPSPSPWGLRGFTGWVRASAPCCRCEARCTLSGLERPPHTSSSICCPSSGGNNDAIAKEARLLLRQARATASKQADGGIRTHDPRFTRASGGVSGGEGRPPPRLVYLHCSGKLAVPFAGFSVARILVTPS